MFLVGGLRRSSFLLIALDRAGDARRLSMRILLVVGIIIRGWAAHVGSKSQRHVLMLSRRVTWLFVIGESLNYRYGLLISASLGSKKG